jgi:hypothetical protein
VLCKIYEILFYLHLPAFWHAAGPLLLRLLVPAQEVQGVPLPQRPLASIPRLPQQLQPPSKQPAQ